MAGTTGLEPATSAVTGQRSNQLSYVPRLFCQQLGFYITYNELLVSFRRFAQFYFAAAVDSILGSLGHQVSTKSINATTR